MELLIAAAIVAVLGLGTAAARASTVAPAPAGAIVWPSRWRTYSKNTKRPSAAFERAVHKASDGETILARLLFALARRESGFQLKIRGYAHGGTPPAGLSEKQLRPYRRYAASYARYQDLRIPGSTITWGQKFKPEDWRPYGALQINPYAIWGIVVPASAPLSAAYDPDVIARAGARLLRQWLTEIGSYAKAIGTRWNGSPSWLGDVLANYQDLGGSLTDLAERNV